MRRQFHRIIISLIWIALATSTSTVFAQSDPGCQFANILLGALGGRTGAAAPCPPNAAPSSPNRAPAQQQSSGTVYTPQNVQRIVQAVKTDLSLTDPATATRDSLPSCAKEIEKFSAQYRPQAPGTIQSDLPGSGLLQQQCEHETRSAFAQFEGRMRDADHQRFLDRKQEEQRLQAQADEKKAQMAAAEEKLAFAELRAGKRVPTNCHAQIVTKGFDPKTANAPVMQVAYSPPKGLGMFMGSVSQINGDTVVLSQNVHEFFRLMYGASANAILKTGSGTKVFEPEQIRVGAVVIGYATQSGTQAVTLANGAASTRETRAAMEQLVADNLAEFFRSGKVLTPPG